MVGRGNNQFTYTYVRGSEVQGSGFRVQGSAAILILKNNIPLTPFKGGV